MNYYNSKNKCYQILWIERTVRAQYICFSSESIQFFSFFLQLGKGMIPLGSEIS